MNSKQMRPASSQNQQRVSFGGPRGGGWRGGNFEKPKNKKKTFFRLINYIKDTRKLLIILIAILLVITLMSLISPIIQSEIINVLSYNNADEKSMILKFLINLKIVNSTSLYSSFISLLLLLAVCYLINIICSFIRGFVNAYLTQRVVVKIRKDLFSKLVYLPIKYFDSNHHGDIMSRMTNDVDSVSSGISSSVATFITTLTILLGAFTIMLIYSPLITLVSLISIALSIVASQVLGRAMRKYFKKQQAMLGDINAKVEENITGIKTLSSYSMEDAMIEKFTVSSNELKKIAIKAQIFGGAMGPVMNIIGNLGFILVVVSGALFYNFGIGGGLFGPITIGTIILFTECLKQINRPINALAQIYAQIETSLAAAERIFSVMDQEKEIDEGHIILDEDYVIEKISFKHVYFSYTEGEAVLKDFNLEIRSDEKIALVGATGSGKTTVVNLLMRFYEIDSGEILINDLNIKDIKKESLRQLISIVLQDTVLFTDTIEANIKYGNPQASIEEMLEAAHLSNSDKFINLLPETYQTILKLSGANLSLGQRQLLTIARATITKPKILILDEATSSVDTRTEKHIQDAMVNLMKNRTSLIIAHRLSTIQDADKIVVMEKGEVKETGTHAELLKLQGIYSELYYTQFSGNAI